MEYDRKYWVQIKREMVEKMGWNEQAPTISVEWKWKYRGVI